MDVSPRHPDYERLTRPRIPPGPDRRRLATLDRGDGRELRIDARRDRLRLDPEAAVAGSVEARMPAVEAARSGDVEAIRTILDAARDHPEGFGGPGFAEQLCKATGEAPVQAGVVLAELLESA